jgi:hypothetical protein
MEYKMNWDNSQYLGSETARQGFQNERDVIECFRQWPQNSAANNWIRLLGHNLENVRSLRATKISGSHKADILLDVEEGSASPICHPIQVKLVSNLRGYNQIDKRWVDRYMELWDIPSDVCHLLKMYTGELHPYRSGRDNRRMFADEFTSTEQNMLCDFFRRKKELILTTIFRGGGEYTAEWLLVIQKARECSRSTLWPINRVIDFFGSGEITITDRGSFRIGRITIQRKGGNRGRETAKMLQFKINPAEILGPV